MSESEPPSPPSSTPPGDTPPSSPPGDSPPSTPPGSSQPPPPPPSSQPGENRTIMIVLSYLWILALIPLLVEKEDAEVQWHAKHGLVLTGAELAFWIVVSVINVFSGFVGCLLGPVFLLIWLAIVGLHVVCIVKGVKGERFLVPGLSQYADRF